MIHKLKRFFANLLKTVPLAIATVLVSGFMIGSTTTSASAAAPEQSNSSCSGVDYNVGANTCVDFSLSDSSSKAATSSDALSVNGFALNGSTTVLSYIQANGITKAQKRGAKVYILKHDTILQTDYHTTSGAIAWHKKLYRKGHKFFFGPDGYWHDGKCYNRVVGIPKGPKKPPAGELKLKGKVKIVKEFVFDVQAAESVSGTIAAKSTSWANLYDSNGRQTCHSESNGFATAAYGASGYARLSGRVFVSVKAALEAAASGANADLKAKLKGKSVTELKGDAYVSARGSASAMSSSQASCITYKDRDKLTCPEVYGPGYTGHYPNCTKDGTSTPTPPSTVPGPNPTPSDPGPGAQCYSETTGLPVQPQSDGKCPPGSFGG